MDAIGELFSDRHPTVPGWYWLSNGVERIVAQLFPSRRTDNLLACHIDLGDAVKLTTVLELGWKFGPLKLSVICEVCHPFKHPC